LHRAVESGVTLFDAADVYGAGHSERLLCSVLAAHPEVLVATKFGNTSDEDTRPLTGVDTSPTHVRNALHASLRRLGRDRAYLQAFSPTGRCWARTSDLLLVRQAL
jgi:aryl-alcohol dehydrogenase-like predicted oxidoreductase